MFALGAYIKLIFFKNKKSLRYLEEELINIHIKR